MRRYDLGGSVDRLIGVPPVKIEPLSDILGAAVSGLDLTNAVDNDDAAALHEALKEHLVLCIRGQQLAPPRLCKSRPSVWTTEEIYNSPRPYRQYARSLNCLQPPPFVGRQTTGPG